MTHLVLCSRQPELRNVSKEIKINYYRKLTKLVKELNNGVEELLSIYLDL